MNGSDGGPQKRPVTCRTEQSGSGTQGNCLKVNSEESSSATDTEASSADANLKDIPSEGCLARITPVTVPGCASCLTTVFLLVTVGIAAAIFFADPDHVPWTHSITWIRLGLIVALIIAIPMLLHRFLNLWLEGEKSKFPDLEYAWYAGLQALVNNGVSIRSTPVYLIIGTKSEQQEKAIFAASNLGMRVEGVPEGPAPIHWYANPDGIYICCSDASWSSGLASLREELFLDAAGLAEESPVTAPEPAAPVNLPAAAAEIDDTNSGTMMLENFVIPGEGDQTSSLAREDTVSPATEISATMDNASEIDTRTSTEIEPVILSPQYAAASLQELQYLGQLLRRIREPACGINGIVSMLQLEAIHGTPEEMDELKNAIHADLEAIHYATQVFAPVTTLIVGLENERGFRELIRRVGKEKSTMQRFGKKFNVQVLANPHSLASLSAHVCGAFEDWCYFLFREEKSLSQTRNTRLYELLAKVRLSWKSQLGEILSKTIARRDTANKRPFIYSGCYVAATGSTPDRQGFVKGFLEKLGDEQEFVEWTEASLRADAWRKRFSGLGFLVSLALLGSLITMFVIAWLTQ